MGGDHKCPVCQATFTRPQHVARHMRSHTGDRPYKCQYCGDQFARSDLLARHINKCHANEKPLPNTVPGSRRKGSAAASRATTSKQACDQCVQSSLPCDGANPCSKCLSRKSRCTYVKFHRQTAPSGPGHHPPHSPSSSSSSLPGVMSSRLPSRLDDFILGPPPSAQPVTTFPGPEQIFNTPFTFNPAAAAYPAHWTGTDMSQMPFPMSSDADLAAKYRTQAEFLRRPIPPHTMAYTPGTQNQSPSSNWYPSWSESGTYPALDDTKPLDGIVRTHSLTSSEPTSFAPEFYGAGFIGSAYRPRRVSLDFSDSSSATSQSVPSSASSSNVHLPLTGSEIYESHPEEMQGQPHTLNRRGSVPTTQPPPFPSSSEQSQPSALQQPQRVGEGGFSSAFGLMSIDDPNVLAGLSSDGVPFFSNLGMGVLPHSPNATPMPVRVQHGNSHQARERGMSLSALPTPRSNKDTSDARELKDAWKMYMRSPLSGSGTATLDSSQPMPLPQMPQSPSGRRRMRVSSLPSVTPTAEKDQPLAIHGEAGAVRPTLHGNPEDLRSYEAAVNARNASLNLNLVPKRRGTRPSASTSPQMENAGVALPASATGQEEQRISRPSSSSSTSSLAQAFTVPTTHPPHHHAARVHAGVVKPPPLQGASISLPIPPSMSMSVSGTHSSPLLHSHSIGPGSHHTHGHSHSVSFGSATSLTFESSSRASSVTSDGTGTGGSGSDGETMMRPSFKRYPSQTLGPARSKRALVEREKGTINDGENMGMDVDGVDVFGPRGARPVARLPRANQV